MPEFLVPKPSAHQHYHDPYTASGARSIMRRFNADAIEMIEFMLKQRKKFEDGKTMLAQSPLASKVYVAAAMKTLGFVREHPTKNGACALTLTEKAINQIENMKRFA